MHPQYCYDDPVTHDEGNSVFATCSFPEYRPDVMGGIPVRTSNGYPRYTLKYPLIHAMPSTFPNKNTIRGVAYDRFVQLYRAKLDSIGIEAIQQQAHEIRRKEDASEDTPIVLLCFEQLAKKPDTFCHRNVLADWLSDKTDQSVPELGSMPKPEIKADEHPGLF